MSGVFIFPRSDREFSGPYGVIAGQWRVGLEVIEMVGVARLVVHPVKGGAEVQGSVRILGAKRYGNDRQAVAEPERPEIGIRTLLGPADKDRVGATRPLLGGKGRPASKQVDLDKMDRTLETVGPFRKILTPVLAYSSG